MSQAFDVAMQKLDAQGMLSDAEIEAIVGEHGNMTEDEHVQLSVEIYERVNSGRAQVSLDQYLEATQTLESAEPGTPAYQKAEAIAKAFETGA